MKKLVVLAVSCLLCLCGEINAKTAYKQHKQNIKEVKGKITALNRKIDLVVQKRDRLTAHLKKLRQQYQEERS